MKFRLFLVLQEEIVSLDSMCLWVYVQKRIDLTFVSTFPYVFYIYLQVHLYCISIFVILFFEVKLSYSICLVHDNGVSTLHAYQIERTGYIYKRDMENGILK